ncbi:MAG: hypothetical protein SNJ77_09355, partial [Cytophagales bacterium]
KQTTLRYDYLLGGYIKSVQLLEKLKPKTDDGRKLTLVTKGEDDKTGDIYVLASIKPKIGRNMAEKNPRPYDLYYIKFNKELDILSETVIPFDAPQTLLAAEFINKIDEEDPNNPGIEFASIVLTSASEEKKENPYITYLRLDEKTKIVHRETITAQEPIWRVDDVIYNRPTNEVFIMGPATENIGQLAKDKFKAFQLWKINSEGKTAYNTSTKIDEFEAKLITPPSQKKSPAYNGKKFSMKTNLVAENGELFIGGQNYRIDQSGKDKGTRNYKDILGFHFDANGHLKSQYGVDTKETNKVANDNAAPQEFIEGRGGNIFWLIREIKGINPKYLKLLTYPRLAKIDTKEGKISDLMTLGKGEGYYLDPNYPFLNTDKGNRVVFFGSNKSGKELWFCRVLLK